MTLLRRIANLPLCLTIAAPLRRLAERVVRLHMQQGFDDASKNGENWLISLLAPGCRSFVDIGGNQGDWTASFLEHSPSAEGVVFDPSHLAAEKLLTRFSGCPRVTVRQVAVSGSAGRAAFFEEPDAGLSSSLLERCAKPTARRVEVEVTTLDREFPGGTIDFLKIDAEGHDLAVLRGARSLLAAKAIRFIQFEYHSTWAVAGATLCAALDLLEQCGYRVFLLKGPALYEPNYELYGEYFSYANYFALRSEDRAVVSAHVKPRQRLL